MYNEGMAWSSTPSVFKKQVLEFVRRGSFLTLVKGVSSDKVLHAVKKLEETACFSDLDLVLKEYGISWSNTVTSLFVECRTTGFPYYELGTVGGNPSDTLIRYFHRSIWHANKRGCVSPFKAWNDDDLLLRVIENRLIYSRRLTPSKVLRGFSISGKAPRVSLFPSSLASDLIQEYGKEYTSVFDPFSGYSGRMLGAMTNSKFYIGLDLNEEVVRESRELLAFMDWSCGADLDVKDSSKETGVYGFLFTCPPYSDIERWNNETFIKTSDEWVEICLENFKCDRYLFVVDLPTMFVKNIVRYIENKSHFGYNREAVLLFDSNRKCS